MNDHILLIEDDPQQSETIVAVVNEYYKMDVKWLETERAFYDWIEEHPGPDSLPMLIICDVMLPWEFPSSEPQSPPLEVSQGTFRKAGMRCWNKCRQSPTWHTVPWIYFTVLDDKTIELDENSDDRTGYAQKAGSVMPLVEQLAIFLGRPKLLKPA